MEFITPQCWRLVDEIPVVRSCDGRKFFIFVLNSLYNSYQYVHRDSVLKTLEFVFYVLFSLTDGITVYLLKLDWGNTTSICFVFKEVDKAWSQHDYNHLPHPC